MSTHTFSSDSLPDQDPESLQQLKDQLAQLLAAISEQGSAGAVALQTFAEQTRASGNEMIVDPNWSMQQLSVIQDLSPLVASRKANESRESSEGARSKSSGTPRYSSKVTDDKGDKGPTERQLISRRIYDVLRLEEDRGTSSGLNRKVRWEKSAAGSGPVDPELTGNSANAQIAARNGSSAVGGCPVTSDFILKLFTR